MAEARKFGQKTYARIHMGNLFDSETKRNENGRETAIFQ